MPTGDLVILALVVVVLLAVTGLGCAVLWDVLNPSEWTAAGWAAVGAWISGVATFVAAGVALLQSRRARADAARAIAAADQQHKEQLRYEIRRADTAAVAGVVSSWRDFTAAMRRADRAVEEYRRFRVDAYAGKFPFDDEDADFYRAQEHGIRQHLSPVQTMYASLRQTRLTVRTPELRSALDEATKLVKLSGDQIHRWSIHAFKFDEPGLPPREILDLSPDTALSEGVLTGLAMHAETRLQDALDDDPHPELWGPTTDDDATMTS